MRHWEKIWSKNTQSPNLKICRICITWKTLFSPLIIHQNAFSETFCSVDIWIMTPMNKARTMFYVLTWFTTEALETLCMIRHVVPILLHWNTQISTQHTFVWSSKKFRKVQKDLAKILFKSSLLYIFLLSSCGFHVCLSIFSQNCDNNWRRKIYTRWLICCHLVSDS